MWLTVYECGLPDTDVAVVLYTACEPSDKGTEYQIVSCAHVADELRKRAATVTPFNIMPAAFLPVPCT